MKPLYTEEEYNSARGKDLMPLECENCGKTYYRRQARIKYDLKKNINITACSTKCGHIIRRNMVSANCGQCNKTATRSMRDYLKSKSGHIFCSQSCAARYNNSHKIIGYRRSKMEIWIEEQLKILYPDLEILFNDKTAILSELDIYIPSLSLAFELNGIFHYEPIYGENKLEQIIRNDNNKFYLCQQNNINLCIIDISSISRFKPLKAQKFLDIIINIIQSRIRVTLPA